MLSPRTKLKIYKGAVVSIAQYGCECWHLDEKLQTKLRAWNCRKLVVLSGLGYREVYNAPPYDLVGAVISRRLKWLGQLLRAKEEFLPRRVAIAEFLAYPENRFKGSIFTGAPIAELEELIHLARDKANWKVVENRLGSFTMSYR